MKKRLRSSFLAFLPFFLCISGFCLLTAVVSRQIVRQSATDVLYVSGEAMINIIKSQGNLVVSGRTTDLASYPQVYILTFNENKQKVSSTVTQNGKPVSFPENLLSEREEGIPQSVTWVPEKKYRQAVLVYKTTNPKGYVVMGRSLNVFDERISQLYKQILSYWVVLSLLTFFLSYTISVYGKKTR